MSNNLEKISLEERGQLFPIFLVEHKEEWKHWYTQERETILSILSNGVIKRISHIGSTAITGIWAKNIVDILVEVNDRKDLIFVKNKLLDNGWLCLNIAKTNITLSKGYTTEGFAPKVFHLHIRLRGDNDELYFRDYLNEHKEIAKEYEALKLSLWNAFEYNREGYTNAKTEFIKKYTYLAKKRI